MDAVFYERKAALLCSFLVVKANTVNIQCSMLPTATIASHCTYFVFRNLILKEEFKTGPLRFLLRTIMLQAEKIFTFMYRLSTVTDSFNSAVYLPWKSERGNDVPTNVQHKKSINHDGG